MASGAGMRMGVGFIAGTASANALSFTHHIQLPMLRPHLGPSSPFLLSRPSLLPRTSIAADNCPAALGDAACGVGGVEWQDAGATALVVAGAYALVSAFDKLTARSLIQQNLSRKLVHILSGLLFMASWPIFRLAHPQELDTLLHLFPF